MMRHTDNSVGVGGRHPGVNQVSPPALPQLRFSPTYVLIVVVVV
jgi:hypothetical protein